MKIIYLDDDFSKLCDTQTIQGIQMTFAEGEQSFYFRPAIQNVQNSYRKPAADA